MKKTILLAVAVIVGMYNVAVAKVWRLNNNPGIQANFTTLQAAYDGASAGDTIMVEPSIIPYTHATGVFGKKLTLIGNGYFLGENAINSTNILPSTISSNLYLQTGSSGSIFLGLTFTAWVFIRTNNIVFDRNNVNTFILGHDTAIGNLSFVRNYIHRVSYDGSYITAYVNNFTIKNNIIQEIQFGVNFQADVSNNTFNTGYNPTSYNSIFQNNIFNFTNLYGKNNICINNVCQTTSTNYIGAAVGNSGTGNKFSVDMTTVFADTGSTDGKYRLKAGSPAIGAGEGEVDCGAFGGANAYVLSGVPAIPMVTKLDVNATNNPMRVTFSAKSNK